LGFAAGNEKSGKGGEKKRRRNVPLSENLSSRVGDCWKKEDFKKRMTTWQKKEEKQQKKRKKVTNACKKFESLRGIRSHQKKKKTVTGGSKAKDGEKGGGTRGTLGKTQMEKKNGIQNFKPPQITREAGILKKTPFKRGGYGAFRVKKGKRNNQKPRWEAGPRV